MKRRALFGRLARLGAVAVAAPAALSLAVQPASANPIGDALAEAKRGTDALTALSGEEWVFIPKGHLDTVALTSELRGSNRARYEMLHAEFSRGLVTRADFEREFFGESEPEAAYWDTDEDFAEAERYHAARIERELAVEPEPAPLSFEEMDADCKVRGCFGLQYKGVRPCYGISAEVHEVLHVNGGEGDVIASYKVYDREPDLVAVDAWRRGLHGEPA